MEVLEADELELDIDLGFGVKVRRRMKLHGIQTPSPRNERRPQAIEAREFLETMLCGLAASGHALTVRVHRDRRGRDRWLGEFFDALGVSINQRMVDRGHARRVEYQ